MSIAVWKDIIFSIHNSNACPIFVIETLQFESAEKHHIGISGDGFKDICRIRCHCCCRWGENFVNRRPL
jgi:hypothetical protein